MDLDAFEWLIEQITDGNGIATPRDLLSLVNSGSYTCGEVQEMTMKHLQDVRIKIADLQRMEQSLVEISSACEGGAVPECPIIDTLLTAGDFNFCGIGNEQ